MLASDAHIPGPSVLYVSTFTAVIELVPNDDKLYAMVYEARLALER